MDVAEESHKNHTYEKELKVSDNEFCRCICDGHFMLYYHMTYDGKKYKDMYCGRAINDVVWCLYVYYHIFCNRCCLLIGIKFCVEDEELEGK